MSGHQEPRFLRLASNRLLWKRGDPYIWPYVVDIDFRKHPPVVSVYEGEAHGAWGYSITASEALMAKWDQHFANAQAEWLFPYLRRMACGEEVTQEELVEHFVRLHGREPETLE